MSVDMRFFRNAAAGKKLPNELLESIRHMYSVLFCRSSDGVPKKTSSRCRCSSNKGFKRWRPMFLKWSFWWASINVSSGRQPEKKTSKWASREYTSRAFSLMWSVFRGHAQKDVFKAAMFEQKKIEKTTSDVPEMKLFKLFIIGLKKNATVKRHCVGHTLFFLLRSKSVTT